MLIKPLIAYSVTDSAYSVTDSAYCTDETQINAVVLVRSYLGELLEFAEDHHVLRNDRYIITFLERHHIHAQL